ncbi:MAG: hypothetical protein RLZ98_2550 [Pseudomonadota bacterium]
MQQLTWTWMSGRPLLHIAVSGEPTASADAESRTAIAAALALATQAGLDTRHLARSRLWARDAATRQIASDIRREMLSGDVRAASASFIAPAHLPAGASMLIELFVMAPENRGSTKIIREYDPPITPPMFVSFDRMVFFSGDTSKEPGLTNQLSSIRRDLDRFMDIAGTSWDLTTAVSIFLARSENSPAGRDAAMAGLPSLPCPFSITVVDGFSAPEKRVEIEVSARLH